jgi:hypothetical protein
LQKAVEIRHNMPIDLGLSVMGPSKQISMGGCLLTWSAQSRQ